MLMICHSLKSNHIFYWNYSLLCTALNVLLNWRCFFLFFLSDIDQDSNQQDKWNLMAVACHAYTCYVCICAQYVQMEHSRSGSKISIYTFRFVVFVRQRNQREREKYINLKVCHWTCEELDTNMILLWLKIVVCRVF